MQIRLKMRDYYFQKFFCQVTTGNPRENFKWPVFASWRDENWYDWFGQFLSQHVLTFAASDGTWNYLCWKSGFPSGTFREHFMEHSLINGHPIHFFFAQYFGICISKMLRSWIANILWTSFWMSKKVFWPPHFAGMSEIFLGILSANWNSKV